jgi:hypothetical protein
LPHQIRFTFLAEGVSAIADLLEEEAPTTCHALWERLPIAATAQHARYSGSEGVLLLPFSLRLAPENATSDVFPGDIGFTWFAPGSSYGVTEEITEICWFYDRDARPTMPEGPVPVNVFARFREGSEAFYQVSKRMAREGVKSLIIERVPEPAAAGLHDVEHCLVYRHPHSFCAKPFLVRAGNGDLMVAFTQRIAHSHGNLALNPGSLPLFVRSSDEGRTWSRQPEAIGEYRLSGVELCGLDVLTNGTLVAQLARFDFAGASRKGTTGYEEYAAATEEQNWICRFTGIYQITSRDMGATWEEAQPISHHYHQHPAEHFLQLPDDRSIKIFARNHVGIMVAIQEKSANRWNEYLLRPLPPGEMGFPQVIPLRDGSFFGVYHASDATPLKGEPSGVCSIYGTRFCI